jgi:hypothetical protein
MHDAKLDSLWTAQVDEARFEPRLVVGMDVTRRNPGIGIALVDGVASEALDRRADLDVARRVEVINVNQVLHRIQDAWKPGGVVQ